MNHILIRSRESIVQDSCRHTD